MNTLLMVNGPNLNLLGMRDPQMYGSTSLSQIEDSVKAICKDFDVSLLSFQANSEGAIVDFLNQNFVDHHNQKTSICGIVVNAGAYAHTSLAIADALEVFKQIHVKIIQVHLSHVYARESFRHHSYISRVANGEICGLGKTGYECAARYLLEAE